MNILDCFKMALWRKPRFTPDDWFMLSISSIRGWKTAPLMGAAKLRFNRIQPGDIGDKKFCSHEVRIPIFIVVISTFTTIVDLVMKAYLPALSGGFRGFHSSDCSDRIIMARAEAFASRKPVILTIVDSLGMGVGYTLVIAAIGVVRELFGYGQFFVFTKYFPSSY